MFIGTKRYLVALLILLSVLGLQAIASVKISVVPESLKAGEKGAIKAVMVIPATMHQAIVPGEEDYFYLKASGTGLSFGKTQYPEPAEKTKDGEWLYKNSVTLLLPFTVKSGTPAGKINVNAELGYNICFDTGSCEPPETVNKTLPLKITGEVTANPNPAIEQTDTMAAGVQDTTKTGVPVKPFAPDEKRSILLYLLMAFLGGIILNVMPCVLPVLSIKAMSIVKQAQHHKSVIMEHSFAYTAGILASFLALAGVIVILKLAGQSVGWGFQFQNTTFVLILASMIFAFAMSLFEVFIINPPGMNAATQASSKGGHGGSFASGVFAVLLATPCSAPLLGTALGFAFAQPPLLIIVFFFLIGLGLAFPFILLGINPSLMKFIPKPGEWMNVFKEVMGFLLLGTTVWLLHVIYQQNGGTYLLRVLDYFVFLAFAIWLYGRFVRAHHPRFVQWLFTIIAIIIIAVSAWIFLPNAAFYAGQKSEKNQTETGFEGWQTFSPELVDSLVAQGKPVFIDFGAKWCMTCISNERTVTTTQAMKKAFRRKNVVLIRGDFTRKNPVMQEFMKKFGRAGVPFYVLYIPGKQPVLFPEVLSMSMLKKAVEQIP